MTPFQEVCCVGKFGVNKDNVRAWLALGPRPDAAAVIRDLVKRGFLKASDGAALEREAGQ